MSNVPFWESAPQLWDTVKIGPYTLPGIAKVQGSVARRIETISAQGNEYSTQTDLGYDGAKITVTLRLWLQEHLDSYAAIAQHIRPAAALGNKPDPLEVIYPAIAILGVRAMTLMKMTIPEPTQDKGVYQATLDFEEFITKLGKPTKNKTKTLTTAAGSEQAASASISGYNYAQKPSAAPPAPPGKK
jgi:hypothetical protein